MKPLAAILFLLAPGILLAHAQRTSSSRDTDPAQGGGNPRSTRGSRKFGTEQQQEASWDSSTVKDNQESSRGQEVVRVARRPGSRDRGYTQANFQEPDTASSVIAPVTHQLLSRSFSQRRSFADAREEDLVETAPRARTSFDSREIADKPLRRRIPSSVKPDATDDNTKGRSDVNTAPGEDVQRIRGGRRKSSTHAPEASADNVGRSPPRRSRTTTISPAQEQPTSGFEGARRRSSPKDTVLTSPSDATPRRRGPANEGNDAVPQEIGSRVTSSTGGSQEINKNSRRKPSRTSAPTTSDDASPLRSRGGARRQPSTQETVGRSSRTGSGRQTATTTTTTTSTTTTSSPPVAVTVKDVEELQVTASSEPEGTAGTRDHIPVVETVDDLPANTGPASIVDAFSTTSKVNGPNSGKPRESVGGSVDVSKISRNAAGPRNASPSSNDRRKKTFSRSTTAEQASESQSVESSTTAIFSRRKSLRNQATDRDENIPASRKQTLRNWRTTHSPLDQDEPISASAVPEAANLISFPAEVVSTTRGPEVVPNELNAIPELVQPVNAEQGFRRLRVPLRKDQTDASGDAGSQEIVRTRPSSRSNAASGKRDGENTPVRSETVPKFNRRPSRPSTSDDANLSPTSSNRDRTTESSVADVMSGRRKVAAEPLRRGVDPQISKGRPKDPFKFEPRRPGRLSSSANAYRTSHEQVEMRPEAGVTLEESHPMEVQETRDILKNVRYTEQIEPSRSPQSDLEESFITRSSQQVVTITVLPETTSAIQAPVNSLFSSRSPDFPTRFANLRNKYRASLDAEAKASSGTRTRKYQKPGSDAAPATESSRQIPATLAGRPDHGPRHRFSPGAAERPLFSAGYRKSSSPPSPLEEDVSRPSSTPSRSTSGIRRSVPITPPSDVSTTSSSVGVPRFSARYKSDLLRAATGLRATTTPVYLPTVPTVRPNTSTTTEGTSITTSSVDLLIVASTIGADTATTRMVTEETTIADFDDEILGANSDNDETSEEIPSTTEAPSAMTTLPPPPPPPSTTAEPLGETTTTTTTESPPTTAMAPVSETTTPTATTTTTEETITTSTPTPVLEGSPSGDEPVTSSPPSSTDPPITTESTATTTTETTTTTTTEPTTTTTEPTTTTTTTTTTEPITTTTTTEPTTTTTTTTEPTTTTTTTEPTTTTTTTTEPTTTTTTTTEPTTTTTTTTTTEPTTTTTTTEPTTTTTTETTTTSAPYSTTPASRFVSRMAVAPIGTPSSTPATNLFDDFNSVYQTAQRREDTDEGSSSLLLISSLRNRLTTPRAERRISDQENDINYQPPAGTSSNSFTSFNLGPSPPLFASSRASLDFPGYTPTQSPYYSTPPRPPRTPVPYVIFGIFPNNTVFRKFPNSNVKEIVSENEIANRQPYYPEQRGNDYDVYRPTAGYSEGRNFSPFVSSVTVTPSTTERAVPGLSEIDEEEENHLLLFLSVNRGASSSTEQSEVDVRIGEPSTVVFTSTETPSSIGEPSSLVLVSTEPPSSTTTEPSTTTTTTEPSTTTTTTEPSTTTTTTEPSTTTTTTEPSTTTTTTEPSTTTTTTEPSTTTTTTEPSTTTTTTEPSTTTTTTEPSTTTTTTEPSTTTTTTELSTTTTTTEPSTTTTTEPSTTTTTTEPSTTTTTTEPSTTTTTTQPSTTATSTATVFVVTPAQSDDKPLGAPKSPDSSGKESVPGGKNPPGSLPDISGLGNSLQVQTRSSSPRPTGNQDSPSALANRIIEMALQRQKAATPSQLVGSASTPRSVMVSTAGAENELLRLLGQSAGRLPQSPTALKGTSPDSTALLALLQNTNKDASKSSQHLLASFSGRQPTQSELLNKINLGEVLSLAAQMKPSSSPGTATPQGGLRQVFSTGGGSSGSAQGLVDVAINMTRAMSTLMGQVIQGAAQSLQSFVRERTGNLAKYFNFGSG